MSWTDERIDLLRRLWGEGLSASQIADRLGGVSRNAVIGKIHRLGLSGRVKPREARAARERAAHGRPSAHPAPRVMAVGNTVVKVVERPEATVVAAGSAQVVPLTAGVSLLELAPGSCRWPLGDPAHAEMRFCGARVGPGETYCAGHAKLAYPARRKKRDGCS